MPDFYLPLGIFETLLHPIKYETNKEKKTKLKTSRSGMHQNRDRSPAYKRTQFKYSWFAQQKYVEVECIRLGTVHPFTKERNTHLLSKGPWRDEFFFFIFSIQKVKRRPWS